MDVRQSMRQSIVRFKSEMDRVMASPFVNLPASLSLLLDALESEPPVNAYLTEGVQFHLPAGFSASDELARVADDEQATFGPFPPTGQAAAAEAYLIVQELCHQHVSFHDPLFSGYAPESTRPAECFSAFKDEVIMTHLVGNVTAYLTARAQELGIEELANAGKDVPTAPPTPASSFSRERL